MLFPAPAYVLVDPNTYNKTNTNTMTLHQTYKKLYLTPPLQFVICNGMYFNYNVI